MVVEKHMWPRKEVLRAQGKNLARTGRLDFGNSWCLRFALLQEIFSFAIGPVATFILLFDSIMRSVEPDEKGRT